MNTSVPVAAAEADPASSSDLAEGEAGQPRGPTVAPMTRETRAAFWRGYEVAIEACILVIQKRHNQTGREMVTQMRDLMRTEVPRAST